MVAHRLVGLVVDDNQPLGDAISNRLLSEMMKLGVQVDWEKSQDADEAIAKMETHDYDVVVADVIFVRDDGVEEVRLDIVSAARRRSETSFIMSISSPGGPTDRSSNLFDARALGADLAIQREDFKAGKTDTSPDRIAKAIRLTLTVNGRLPGVKVELQPPRDPRIQAVVHQIGSPVIGELYRQCLEADWRENSIVTVRYLTPGASGSAVVQLEALSETGTHRHVMKLNRDPNILSREVTRGKLLENHVDHRIFLRTDSSRPVGPVGGWFGVIMPFSESSTDLRTWIVDAEDPEILRLLTVLFEENLSKMYLRTAVTTDEVNPLEDLTEAHFRQVRVSAALRRIVPALRRVAKLSESETRTVENTVNDFFGTGVLLGRPPSSLPQTNWRCQVHGDLHGGNVLVYLGALQSPALIDTSEVGVGHWASDAARLHVDFVLDGTATREHALFWDDLLDWRETSRQASLPMGADPMPTSSFTAAALLSRLSSKWGLPSLLDIEPARWEWTWHLALANQYARATYRPALPPPVVALAALNAFDQLQLAADRAPS